MKIVLRYQPLFFFHSTKVVLQHRIQNRLKDKRIGHRAAQEAKGIDWEGRQHSGYVDAYNLQLTAFIENVLAKKPVSPSFEDGRRAQMLADAAQKSLETGSKVTLDW